MKGQFRKRVLAGCLALLLASGNVPAAPLADMFGGSVIAAGAADYQNELYLEDLAGADEGKTIAQDTELKTVTQNYSYYIYINNDPYLIVNFVIDAETGTEIPNYYTTEEELVITRIDGNSIYLSTPNEKTLSDANIEMQEGSAAIRSVTLDGKTLAAGTDYTFEYFDRAGNKLNSAPASPGTYTVTITGTGEYMGQASKQFKIARVINSYTNISGVSVIDTDLVIDGCSRLIIGNNYGRSVLTVNGSLTLTKGVHEGYYNEESEYPEPIILSNDIQLYDACLIINGDLNIGQYSKMDYSSSSSVIVTGQVSNDSWELFPDTAIFTTDHRDIVYHEDGDYFTLDGGDAHYSFDPDNKKFVEIKYLSDADIVMGNNSAAVGSVKIDGNTLAEGTDYTLEYYNESGNKLNTVPAAPGRYTVKIIGCGSYSDYIPCEIPFTIYAEVDYLDKNGKPAQALAMPLDGTETALGGEVYYVSGSLSFDHTVTLTEDTQIIVADGAVLSFGSESAPLNGCITDAERKFRLELFRAPGSDPASVKLYSSDSAAAVQARYFDMYGTNVTVSSANKGIDASASVEIRNNGDLTVNAADEGVSAHKIQVRDSRVSAKSLNSTAINAASDVTVKDSMFEADGNTGVSVKNLNISLSESKHYINVSSYSVSDFEFLDHYHTDGNRYYRGKISADQIEGLNGHLVRAAVCTVSLPDHIVCVGNPKGLYYYDETYRFKAEKGYAAFNVMTSEKTDLYPDEDGLYELTVINDTTIFARIYRHFPAAEPTCEKDGSREYYEDSNGKYLMTDSGLTEASYLDDILLKATGHSFETDTEATVWTEQQDRYQVEVHLKCSKCGKKAVLDKTYVSYSAGIVTKEPTADEKGVMTYSAAVNYEGKTYTAVKKVAIPKLSEERAGRNVIDSASVTLSGELGLNFYIQLPSETAAAGAKVVMNGPEGERTAELSERNTLTGEYKITYPIKAINMAAKVKLQIRDSEGNVLDIVDSDLNDITDDTFEYSIYDYVARAKGAGTLTEKQLDMVNAMYTYGAYSERWKHGRALPGNVEALPVISTDDFKPYQPDIKGASDGIALKSLSLVLDSNTALRLYFTCEDITGHTAKYTVDSDEKTLEIVPSSAANEYYVEISNISARNLKSAFTITIDGSLTVEASAMSYVYLSLRNGTAKQEVNDVIRALVAYSNAADKYHS